MPKQSRPKATAKESDSVSLYAVMSSNEPALPFHIKASRRQAKAVKSSPLFPQEYLPVERISGCFPGHRYRVGLIRWGAFEELVKYLAEVKAGRYRLETLTDALKHAIEKTGLRGDVIQKSLAQYVAGSFVCRKPRHALDLPDVLIGDEERHVPGDEFDNRRRAFQCARDINRKPTRHYAGTDWAIVLEIGETLQQPSPLRSSFSRLGGVETVTTYRPVRVLKPTPSELKELGCGNRHAVAAS